MKALLLLSVLGCSLAAQRPDEVRWQGGPAQITVRGPETGKYGESVYRIEARNSGREPVTGTLLPPFTKWRDTEEGLRASSSEHMLLSSRRLEIGTLGAHRSWSAGSEFDADQFSTIPSNGNYLAAVLMLATPEVSHEREVVTLQPGQTCRYELHAATGKGGRNDALRETYRVRGGYRVNPARYRFDAYNDPDLSWAKSVTSTWLNWAWDKENIDPRTGEWRLSESLAAARRRFGGFDAFILWPFWPRAGFDNRSQFDHYAGLPGGLDGLRDQIRKLHAEGVRVFLSYCHWSDSDRDKSPAAMSRSYGGFADLACRTEADGALMDLMSSTPEEILARARQCGRKLVPYNEGDPAWSDTQTNLLGRIHNDLPMPEFNLKRYLLPHHPQLRVCEPGNTGRRMRNDFVLSFFNGHGVEINTMFPENHPANDADWPILARALDLLRTHRANFASPDWDPLIASEDPAVWINRWPAASSTLYTIRGTNPGGHHGPLLRVPREEGVHYVDLWRYRPIRNDGVLLSYDVDGFTPGLGGPTGTANDSPGCIGAFRRRLKAVLDFEMLRVETAAPVKGEQLEVWLGTVRPDAEPVRLPATASMDLDLYRQFGRHTNEAIIVRLHDSQGQVEDVDIIPEAAVRFFHIDKPRRTPSVQPGEKPADMVRIAGGRFRYRLTNPPPPERFPYASPPFQPQPTADSEVELKPFWIDRHLVTNAAYARFAPGHSVDGNPVVNVTYDEAKAYSKWAGKRLPTEEEWQFAAESGAGVEDLTGRLWQWTASLMDNGRHLIVLLRGGSAYHPPNGRWWVPGGPRKITQNYPLPLDGPAMNRLATVGFRCVKDE